MRNRAVSLYIHEWVVVVFVMSLLLAVGIRSVFSPSMPILDDEHAVALTVESVFVTVDGAVEKPGTYAIQRGTTMREFLDIVGLSPAADTSKMRLDSKVRNKQKVVVRTRKE